MNAVLQKWLGVSFFTFVAFHTGAFGIGFSTRSMKHEFFDQNADLQSSTQKFEDTNITLVILHLFPIINKLDENNTMIKNTIRIFQKVLEKEDFELYVGEWTSTDLINTMYSIIFS